MELKNRGLLVDKKNRIHSEEFYIDESKIYEGSRSVRRQEESNELFIPELSDNYMEKLIIMVLRYASTQ